MSHTTDNTHLLVYPFTGAGHIIPLLDLTHLLLRRGFTVTVVISAGNLPLLDPLQSSHPSSLRHLLLPDPTPKPNLVHPIVGKVLASEQLFTPIVDWFQRHPSPPATIVSDFFLGWTNDLARHLGIRRVMFSPSGALGSSLFHTLWRDISEINARNVAGDENYLMSFPEIPNSPEFPWWQLSQVLRDYKKGDPDLESFGKRILANMTSWGIVYNTFEELEGVYIENIKKQVGHDRVWGIGPLLPDDHGPITSIGRGGSGDVSPDDLFIWLDKKNVDSVVYICFGSRTSLSEDQMSVLLSALERTKVNFVLCVKTSDSTLIPNGFEDRVIGRGFIVRGWAPQLAILRHRAVGSFVTHCGWNSTLEGVAAGVMMLIWPMGADQFANAKLLVDQLGVGARVCEGGPKFVPDSTELTRLLDESLSGDRPELVKVKMLSQAAFEAVKEGTSRRDLDMFAKLLSEL